MKQATYLYGHTFDNEKLKGLLYIEALEYKIKSAKELIEELCEQPYAINNQRINDIANAIKFNERLIDEANGKERE